MKRIILALLLVSLAATWAWAAYSNIGYKEFTSDATVTITGAPAGNLSIGTTTTDCTFILNPDRDDDGTPLTVKAGDSVTLTGISVYGFTVDWSGGVVDAYWW